jgi:hypothetical protein
MTDQPQKDPKTGRFLPGNSGYGGRPKGSRNKLGESFIAALAEDFEAHGAKAIQECRKKAPHKYLSVIAQLLPKEAKVEISQDIHVSITEFVRNFRLIREAQEVIGVSPPLLIEAEDDDGQ